MPDVAQTATEDTPMLGRLDPVRLMLSRPSAAALVGVVLVWTTFAVSAADSGFLSRLGAANYLETAAQVGILGSAVTLLMIAGEFDLSVGAVVGVAGMVLAILVTHYSVPLPLGIIAALS